MDDPIISNPNDEHITQIIVGIHGVGTPAIGTVARSILQGLGRAFPGVEGTAKLLIAAGLRGHAYDGFEVATSSGRVRIWEVNWSDLKGFPNTAIGSVFYALKALVALIQIADKGWDTKSVTGPLLFGSILRAYFCVLCFVAPIALLLIAYADNRALFDEDRWRFDAAGWCFIGLNSLVMNTGLASAAEQLDWLASELSGIGGKLLALFLHKPLYLNAPDDPELVATSFRYVPMPARSRLLEMLDAVDLRLVASGHVHQRRISLFPVPATSGRLRPLSSFPMRDRK
jgi:hypothetical protein